MLGPTDNYDVLIVTEESTDMDKVRFVVIFPSGENMSPPKHLVITVLSLLEKAQPSAVFS